MSSNQLTELKEKINQKKQAGFILEKTRALLKDEQIKLAQLTVTVNKEYDDVLKLEGNSLASVFHSFLGNRVEKIDKEKQEYLSAKLKYQTCKGTVQKLEFEIKNQELKLLELGNPEAEYKNLIDSKKEMLKAQNDKFFISVSEKMESSYSLLIEVNEALLAGEKAYLGVGKAIQSMESARGWGTFDLLGGGMIATAVKHSHIDNAKSEIQQVQFLLKRFISELQDVKINLHSEMVTDFDGFTRVADFFFDNLIFDWIVQSRINKTLDSLVATQARIRRIIVHLKKKSATLKSDYQILKQELSNYLENSV